MKANLLPALVSALIFCSNSSHASDLQLLEDVKILSADDMRGRLVGTEGSERARAYLVERLRAIGVDSFQPNYAHAFTAKHDSKPLMGVNLIGHLPGTGESDRVLVIGAHYDHFGVHKGQILNGADDNASGVAALLAIAEDFARTPPKHPIIFAFWDAEEQGFFGSGAFIADPPVARERIAMNLNMDMISRGKDGVLWIAGAHHYPFLRPHFEALAKQAPVTLKIGHDGPPWSGMGDWTKGSDHYSFHRDAIPFAYLGVEDHADYHGPGDDFSAVPQDFYVRAAKTALLAARMFDDGLSEIAKAAGRGGDSAGSASE